MRHTVVIALLFGSGATALPDAVHAQWTTWKARFGAAQLAPEEEAARKQTFSDNLQLITKHNEEAASGAHSFTMGLGPFTAMTHEQYRFYLSDGYTGRAEASRNIVRLVEDAADMPSTVDWRAEGAVTAVKNQLSCGSCWSFSTTGAVEGAHKIAGHDLVALSEQQLVDCSGVAPYKNKGCDGGSMDSAFQYIADNGGLAAEEAYPYTAKDGSCDVQRSSRKLAGVASFVDVPPSEEAQLLLAAAKTPISIAIEADKAAFQHYKAGVLGASAGCGTDLDHGVLIVGFGTTTTAAAAADGTGSGQDYWIVKNSWGAGWGDAGYIKLARGTGAAAGVCGINLNPSYPIAADPAPAPAPAPGPFPSPPSPPAPPAGQCEVSAWARRSCGHFLSQADCEELHCCYDDSVLLAAHCFHPEEPAPPPPPLALARVEAKLDALAVAVAHVDAELDGLADAAAAAPPSMALSGTVNLQLTAVAGGGGGGH